MRRRPFSHAARALPALALAACQSPYAFMEAHSADDSAFSMLGIVVFVFMSLVVLVMAALVLIGALRRRGTLLEHEPPDAPGDQRWILIGGLLIPAIVVSVLYVTAMVTLHRITPDQTRADLNIQLVGHRWWWEARYYPDNSSQFVTANELHIPLGKTVRITLQSSDVIHSLWIPRLHGKLDLIPGHVNQLVLRPTRVGVYRGECAEYCGLQHAHMQLRVYVDSLPAYQRWAATERQPAATPTSPGLARGQQIFEQNACGLCHTIRGTSAMGTVGPDLTHLAARGTIAAASLENNRANLQAWVVGAQSLKPGVEMPSLSVLDGPSLQTLVTYLQSLR